jgi:hypothetical protein
MELWQKIVKVYPELADNQFAAFSKEIILQDDTDGAGAYIAKWDYSKPIPEGLTLGKPSA